ncbi:MAG TPA: ATP synthase F1 subunit epsilon, partial [bacterium]|nr:ATP synthase F1 subunit epsilon [bacterium]
FFKLQVVAPDHEVFHEEVSGLTAPGAGGEFGVLARHEPLLSSLKPGAFTVDQGATRTVYFVSGGFIEVTPTAVTVLAEEFEPARDIDGEQEERARKKAQEKIARTKDPVERDANRAILARAQARLAAVQKAQAPSR